MIRLLPILLVLLSAPLLAQDAPAPEPQARLEALRNWHDALTPQRRELLQRRLRMLRRLPREGQQAVLEAARQNRPLLTETQRKNLAELESMPYLRRVRLYTLQRELEMTRRAAPAEFRRAMEAPNREAALNGLLWQQRAQRMLADLPGEEQQRLRAMPPRERMRTLRERAQAESRRRMADLKRLNPRLPDLRRAAASGDSAARAELADALADLATVDMLLQRLSPGRREAVMARLPELELERAVNLLRRELNAQWQEAQKLPHQRPARDQHRD